MKIKFFLAKLLKSMEIDTVFSLPAYYITELIGAMRKEKINVVEFASEFSAISAAYSYSILSNKIGVVLVNTGPSFTNILTGLKTAEKENVPLLVLVGSQGGLYSNDESYFQVINIKEYVKEYFCVTKENLFRTKQHIESIKYKKVPVVMQISYELYETEMKHPVDIFNKMKSKKNNEDAELYKNVMTFGKEISYKKKPLFLLGNGVDGSNIQELFEEANIPFISSLYAKKILFQSKKYIGSVGILGDVIANELLREADALICLGCRLSERTILNDLSILDNKDIYFINNGTYYCKYNLSTEKLFEYFYEAELFIKVYFQNLMDPNNFLWVYEKKELLQPSKVQRGFEEKKFTITEVIHFIHENILNPVIYCIDDGTYTLPALKLCSDCQFIFPGTMAVGGFSLGAAIGAYFSNINYFPIVIIGDGGILSVLGELHTIKKYHIPVMIVVINNRGYESIRQWYPESYTEMFFDINFKKIAEGFGLLYQLVVNLNDLKRVLLTAITDPIMVEILVETEQIQCHFRETNERLEEVKTC